jgi:S1-C subfamily serine protease
VRGQERAHATAPDRRGAIAFVAAATPLVVALVLAAVERPWTGLLMQERGDGDTRVTVVRSVAPGSPEDVAGLRPTDHVTRIDDIDAADAEALVDMHRRLRPGDVVHVASLRRRTRRRDADRGGPPAGRAAAVRPASACASPSCSASSTAWR